MKPALSLVFFTVLSGAGLGLAVMIALFAEALPDNALNYAVLLSLALVAAGLGASTAHLANPKNAWRAVMRVRTSWLSREAVLAALFFPLLALYAFVADSAAAVALRLIIGVVALLTIYCTAMIYQSLKTIHQWHHGSTAINYLLLGLMSGGVFFNLFASKTAQGGSIVLAALLVVAAVIGKLAYYSRIGASRDISVSQATGLSQAKARLLDAGHTGPTFLTREFIYQQPAALLQQYRRLALAVLLLAPLLALLCAFGGYVILAALAAVVMMGGLLLERWLFFAEAHHSVRAYHGISQ